MRATVVAAFCCLLLACSAATVDAVPSQSASTVLPPEVSITTAPDETRVLVTPVVTDSHGPGVSETPALATIPGSSSVPPVYTAPDASTATAITVENDPIGTTPDEIEPLDNLQQGTPTPVAVAPLNLANLGGTASPESAAPIGNARPVSTMFGPVQCEGSGRIPFTHFPIDPGVIHSIEPMGKMADSHVTPIDHIYIVHDSSDDPGHGYVVRSPAGGNIVTVQRMPNANRPDYRLVIAHTCTLFTTFIHTGELTPALKAVTGDLELGKSWTGAFAVEAGQVFAEAPPSSLDFMVHDQEVVLPGFIVPESYAGEPWKVHTLDPFDFYEEPLRSEVLAFNPRTAEPRGGKIDYDIDGRLVGNWFVEETGGYTSDLPSYWETHLAIAYDHLDPSTLVVSIGANTGISEDACRVCQGAYGVRGNAPDPATVGVADGLVKYELIGRVRMAPGEPVFNDENVSIGTFLAEMTDDRSVRIEVFPGVGPSSVSGFTANAVVYSR
ncbi:MAG: hypothetical protein O3C10_11710 [Chloroflexi bacterium]|nr:hypothetical protein [Chloroflexota bacterium]